MNIRGFYHSKVVKKWVHNTFDERKQVCSYKQYQLIKDLSKMENIIPLIDMFYEFTL